MTARMVGVLMAVASIAFGTDVWVVPSTSKVRFQDGPVMGHESAVDWAGMRGELEHAQICVRSEETQRDVRVVFSALKGPAGTLSPAALSWRQVGYVDCKKTKRYTADLGWWPDPLLDVPGVTLNGGETQPFWITVRIPVKARPGLYTATAVVRTPEVELARIPIALTIWDLDLPHRGTFQTAFTFTYKPTAEIRWFTDLAKFYGGQLSDKIKWRYFDFLAERRLYADNIYVAGPRPLEDYLHLAANGANCFNLMEISNADGKGRRREYSDAYIAMMLAKLGPMVAELRQRELLRYAYVYGFDECNRDYLPAIRRLYGAVKQRFPDLRTMLLVNWEPPIDIDVDIWCYIYHVHKPAAAARWKAAGKQVWWYHCVGPVKPYMNTFVEWPGIQARLLFWLAAKHDIPGWLYYSVDGWHKKSQDHPIHLIGNGGRTDFDPATWGDVNGDGSFLYPGEDGPVATVRLETLCDGIEDLELLVQLRRESLRVGRELAGVDGADLTTSLIPRVVRTAMDRSEDFHLLEMTRREAAQWLQDLRRGKRPDIWTIEPRPASWIFGEPVAHVLGLAGAGARSVLTNTVPAQRRGPRFTADVPLRPGINTLRTTVVFADGHTAKESREVHYRKNFLPPSTKGIRLVPGERIDGMEKTSGWRIYDDKAEAMTLTTDHQRVKEGKAALRCTVHPEKQKTHRVCIGRHIPRMGARLGIAFWLYAEKPGGILGVELCESIAWSNWVVSLPIDWQGWKYIELPWERFHQGGNHMSSGNGIPDWDTIFWLAFNWPRKTCSTAAFTIDDVRYLKAPSGTNSSP